jgi:O-antigen/teichoic acid export membrane protein
LNIKDRFNKNAFVVAVGTLIAQIISISFSPILTRIYNPENFDIFGLYLGISTILGVVITGRYEMAILLPNKKSDALNVVGLSFIITSTFSFLIFLFLFLSDLFDLNFFNKSNLNGLIYLVPLSTLSMGFYRTVNFWNNRQKKYKTLSLGRIMQSLLVAIISLGLGLSAFKDKGLIMGAFLGQAFSALFLILLLVLKDKFLLRTITIKEMTSALRRYIKFPKFLIAGHLMNTSSSQLPLILFSTFFAGPIGGFFLLTQRVISLPISILSSSIGDVFRQEASLEYATNKNCLDLYLSTLKKLIYISIIPFILFYFIAPALFVFVFGEEWIKSGEFAQILIPMFFLQFVTSPLGNMFIVAEKQEKDLLWQLFLFTSVVCSLFVGIFIFEDEYIAVSLFSLSYSISYLLNFYMTYNFAKGDLK